ncbi:hypothetical protein VPHD260_0198 [Vibrio phage D260]
MKTLITILSASVLFGCGGGGGSSTPAPSVNDCEYSVQYSGTFEHEFIGSHSVYYDRYTVKPSCHNGITELSVYPNNILGTIVIQAESVPLLVDDPQTELVTVFFGDDGLWIDNTIERNHTVSAYDITENDTDTLSVQRLVNISEYVDFGVEAMGEYHTVYPHPAMDWVNDVTGNL